MDRYEWKVSMDEIDRLIRGRCFREAAAIADTIDWAGTRSTYALCRISDVYKINKRFRESRDLLEMAYERSPSNRKIIYSLCELELKLNNYIHALQLYNAFINIAPRDSDRYLLQYKLYKAQDVNVRERIVVLEEYLRHEYREKWAYELAELYFEAGETQRCIRQCDEVVTYFGEGRFVIRALELKKNFVPLPPQQEELLEKLRSGKKTAQAPKPSEETAEQSEEEAGADRSAGQPAEEAGAEKSGSQPQPAEKAGADRHAGHAAEKRGADRQVGRTVEKESTDSQVGQPAEKKGTDRHAGRAAEKKGTDSQVGRLLEKAGADRRADQPAERAAADQRAGQPAAEGISADERAGQPTELPAAGRGPVQSAAGHANGHAKKKGRNRGRRSRGAAQAGAEDTPSPQRPEQSAPGVSRPSAAMPRPMAPVSPVSVKTADMTAVREGEEYSDALMRGTSMQLHDENMRETIARGMEEIGDYELLGSGRDRASERSREMSAPGDDAGSGEDIKELSGREFGAESDYDINQMMSRWQRVRRESEQQRLAQARRRVMENAEAAKRLLYGDGADGVQETPGGDTRSWDRRDIEKGLDKTGGKN